jgi:hypothetical protein
MPLRGEDSGPGPNSPVEESQAVRILKMATSASLALLIVALLALVFAPKDPGTLTLYGMVIGINLLIFLAFWPAARWLQRLDR